jgi:hypothetical protein
MIYSYSPKAERFIERKNYWCPYSPIDPLRNRQKIQAWVLVYPITLILLLPSLALCKITRTGMLAQSVPTTRPNRAFNRAPPSVRRGVLYSALSHFCQAILLETACYSAGRAFDLKPLSRSLKIFRRSAAAGPKALAA